MKKIIRASIFVLLLIIPILSVKAEIKNTQATTDQAAWQALSSKEKEARAVEALRLKGIKLDIKASTTERIPDKKISKLDANYDIKIYRASTTQIRIANREMNIEKIRSRLASTTASSSPKKIDQLNDRLAKQREQMANAREKLLEKELKIVDILGQISSKIQDRIAILTAKGLDMTAAKAKLAEATTKIEETTIEGQNLAILIQTEMTDTNKDQLLADVKTSQEKIRDLARAAHTLLVDTIKEINNVLPAKTTIKTTTVPPAITN